MKARLHDILLHVYDRLARLRSHVHASAIANPAVAVTLLLATGIAAGAGLRTAAGAFESSGTHAEVAQLRTQAADAQRAVNAMAARVSELQAEANRLNALGDRLTRMGQLGDGEFDFDKPVGVGGGGPVHDMPAADLGRDIDRLQAQFKGSGQQLSVLESLLFNRKLEQESVPSRDPIANSYITSGFGGRADPFGGGGEFHKGIDFHARIGDPHVKAKQRQMRHMQARRRMMQAVPNATVVVMNPTHYAVALRYEQDEDEAPVCVAKGLDALALKIRSVAEEAGVPVIEDPPLARALYAAVEIDDMIPPAHYEAVAKIIGFILNGGKEYTPEPA